MTMCRVAVRGHEMYIHGEHIFETTVKLDPTANLGILRTLEHRGCEVCRWKKCNLSPSAQVGRCQIGACGVQVDEYASADAMMHVGPSAPLKIRISIVRLKQSRINHEIQ